MNCSQAKLWISMCVDGELRGARARQDLDGHLAACPSCREVFALEAARAQRIESALAGDGDPRSLAARILQASKQAAAPAERIEPVFAGTLRSLRPAFATAALLAVGVLLGLWAVRWVAPPINEPAQAHAAGSLLFLEDRSNTSDVLFTDADVPVGRDLERWRLTIEPAASEPRPGAGVKPLFRVEVETENADYFHLTSYSYR